MNLQPSSTRISETGISALFTDRSRWQSWLDVEAVLAAAQAEIGMIPHSAAEVIAQNAKLERLDLSAVQNDLARSGHPLVPIIWELARICGKEAGGYVHWGATTQNILETGDNILLKQAHKILLTQLAFVLEALAEIAERSADLTLAGRTHGQHAVPITFGYKVAVWIDEFCRHLERLRALENRVFVALLGGATGTFAAFGERGPRLQRLLAKRMSLSPAAVPSRTHRDREVEYVTVLALVAATSGKVANEIYTLMKQEFGEASEPIPVGTVGSSTMPQKRNPILCQDIIAEAAKVRALVPLALEAMMTEHEANRTTTVMMRGAVGPAAIGTGDCLARLLVVINGLELRPSRMSENLQLTDGMILSEAIMLRLAETLGRQVAHDVIYDAVEKVRAGKASFREAIVMTAEIQQHLNPETIDSLLDPSLYTGLSATMARDQAMRARNQATGLLNGLEEQNRQSY
ncbi:MAG: class-II fumarase/aspartase family protein [Hyphomicrobiaceae bacterium]